MPHFLLTFGDASRPPLGAAIIEAPSVFQARMTAVVRRLAPGVPFGEVLNLSAVYRSPAATCDGVGAVGQLGRGSEIFWRTSCSAACS
jgi:hypothetical protein